MAESPLLLEVIWEWLAHDALVPSGSIRSKVRVARWVACARAISRIIALRRWAATLGTLAASQLLCWLPVVRRRRVCGQITCGHPVEGSAPRVRIEYAFLSLLRCIVEWFAKPQRAAPSRWECARTE